MESWNDGLLDPRRDAETQRKSKTRGAFPRASAALREALSWPFSP